MDKQPIIALLDQGKDGLTRTFHAVPDDKLGWKPLDNGRTALDLAGEAAQTAATTAQLLTSKGQMPFSREIFQALAQERASWDKTIVLQELESGHAALLSALEGLSEEELSQPLTLPMGGGMTMPLGGWAMMPYRTYISRFAQINYIQTLYGDMDSH